MKQLTQKPVLSARIARLRQTYSNSLLHLCVLGLLAGIGSALVIALFHALFELPLAYFGIDGSTTSFVHLPGLWHFLLPVIGGAALGLLLSYVDARAREVGVTHVIYCMNQPQPAMPLRNAMVQLVGGALAIATGQSAGKEGPAVHLGSTLSSWLGQWAKLPPEHRRLLIACGTAGAIGASFNTPMAGVIFAIEVVLLQYSVTGFVPVIIAAVTATVIHNSLYGQDLELMAHQLSFAGIQELPMVILCGLIFGTLAALFTRLAKWSCGFSHLPVFWRMLAGGLVCGLVATQVPYIMGTGLASAGAAIHGDYGLTLLLALALAKLLVTSVCVGLGMPMGLIGPTLVIGACTGSALGLLGQMYIPGLEASSGAGFYALLGMSAMMSAVLQAPLAGLIALLELTDNPDIIVPGMMTVVVANITCRYLFKQDSTFIELMRLHHQEDKA